MSEIVRWVHPRKVKNGKLKPSAFPIDQIESAMGVHGAEGRNAISLASFSLLTEKNREAAKNNACQYCARGVLPGKPWPDTQECDCAQGDLGARGAYTKEESLLESDFHLRSATSNLNPLHVLLYKNNFSEAANVQLLLIELFSNIKTVKNLFA